MPEEKEITIGKDGISLKGQIVDEFKKPIAPIMDAAGNILRVFENIIGIPLDVINNKLSHFRQTYINGYSEIPEKRKINPNFRISCSVLKNVAYAIEEDEIQALFAKLLIAASDSDYTDKIHPSYAFIINELTTVDALVLRSYASDENTEIPDEYKESIYKSQSNLIRLGLLEVYERELSSYEMRRYYNNNNYEITGSMQQLMNTTIKLIKDLQELRETLYDDLISTQNRLGIRLTSYGKDFVAIVLGETAG